MQKIWKQKIVKKIIYNELINKIDNDVICKIASVRNYPIHNIDDYHKFINNNLSYLNDSDIVPNIDKLENVLLNKSKSVCIFGDYDVDGTFSSFMFRNILYGMGYRDIQFYIPHRKIDGYGLNEKSLYNFMEKNKNVELVVFLDCGTNSKNEIQILKENLNNPVVIVIDHHIIDENNYSANADLVINNRLNDNVPQYSTGGLVYQAARKLKNKINFDPNRLLPYAAIATISDVSPLINDNRIIVHNGLSQLSTIKNPGLIELIRISGIDFNNCSTEDISFKLAPRINANGRIEHAYKVLSLLNEKKSDKAFEMALEMNSLNEERKKLQKTITESAIKIIENKKDNKNGILLYDKDWEIGIVGIVASKLVDKYGVPAIVFGNHNGQIKGSARSINGINIKNIMDKISYIFDGYGGHEMAAGATLKSEYIKEAQNIFNKAVEEYKNENSISNSIQNYDITIDKVDFISINDEFCDEIQQFGPFGNENEKILFRVNSVKCSNVVEWNSGTGAFVYFDGLDFDCFIYEQNATQKLFNKNIDILFEIGQNFKDDKKWAIIIKDYRLSQRYYAGIGSRETPNDILQFMKKTSEALRDKGWILRSGGAEGADSAFEMGSGDLKEIFLPWKNFNKNSSIYNGEDWKYKNIHLDLAKKHHPNFNELKLSVKKLMIRNSAQIIGKDSSDYTSEFVICYTKDGKDSGGTGQAIRIAKNMGIPVYNLYHEKDRRLVEKIIA